MILVQLLSKPRLVGLFILVQLALFSLYLWTRDGFTKTNTALRLSKATGSHQVNDTSDQQIWAPADNGFIGTIVAAARNKTDIDWIEGVGAHKYVPIIYSWYSSLT